MKIHTTQNLNSLGRMNSTNINNIPSEEIRLNYSEQMRKQTISEPDTYESTVSFRGKKELAKGAIKQGKKTLGERVANSKFFNKLQSNSSFMKALEFAEKQEVMIQASTALFICCLLRPATIMALPSKKNKKDCAFASAHSFSSGVWGFIVPFLFIKPLANGFNHANGEMFKYLKGTLKEKQDKAKEFFPHINVDTIWDASGKVNPKEKIKDMAGNVFNADLKDVRKIHLPKHLSEISEDTLKKLCPDIDLTKVKGVSPSQYVDKNGNPIKLKLEDMFIAIKDSEKEGAKYYPLLHVEENILKDMMPELDLASIKGADGKRIHPENWLNKDGSKFKFDMDNVFVSRLEETDSVIPLITGKTRTDGKEIKDICYQKNNNPNDIYSLGTEISQEMVDADRVNTVVKKLGSWLPDIVVAYPRATATIAIIPWVLKNVLGMEKTPKAPVEPKTTEKEVA